MKVNINTAGISELTQLKGIGTVKAQAIVAYRESHGPFKKIEDITKVKGIGPATFENLKAEITLETVAETEVVEVVEAAPAPSIQLASPVMSGQPLFADHWLYLVMLGAVVVLGIAGSYFARLVQETSNPADEFIIET